MTDDEPWTYSESEAAPPPPRRQRGRPSQASTLNPFQSVILYLARHPWAGFAAIYLGVWVPLSFLLPRPALALNTLGVLACWLAALIGIIMAASGATIRNPAAVLSTLAFGAIASMVVPSGALAGSVGGRASQRLTGKNFGELDAGPGGIMAAAMGGLSVLLLVHIVVLVTLMPHLLIIQRP